MVEIPKNFVVVGLGVFGSHVVRHLARYGVNIIGIDKDERKVESVKEFLKVPIIGDAMDKEQLEQAGVNNKDIDVAIVAIGENVEVGVYVSLLLKEMGIKKVMARALNSNHASILAKIGVDKVIFPEENAADQLVRSLFSPQILEQFELAEDYSVAEVVPPKEMVNKTLREIGLRAKYKVTVISIKRKLAVINEQGETDTTDELIMIPGPEEKILQGDILVIVGKNADIEKFKNI